jgi:hypothetical protein
MDTKECVMNILNFNGSGGRYKLVSCLLFIISTVFSVNTLSAETRVDGDELRELIVGNTLEGKSITWGTRFKIYFDSSGEFKRNFSNDNYDEGEWEINKKGKLCYMIESRYCRRVKKRDDGGYNLYNKKKELRQTFEKIHKGNVFNL